MEIQPWLHLIPKSGLFYNFNILNIKFINFLSFLEWPISRFWQIFKLKQKMSVVTINFLWIHNRNTHYNNLYNRYTHQYDTKNLIIESGITEITHSAFTRWSSLETVDIIDSIITIFLYASFSCTSLATVTIRDSVKIIDEAVFSLCDSLTAVTLGDNVETIERFAFQQCDSLATITLGKSIKTIGISAFQYWFESIFMGKHHQQLEKMLLISSSHHYYDIGMLSIW